MAWRLKDKKLEAELNKLSNGEFSRRLNEVVKSGVSSISLTINDGKVAIFLDGRDLEHLRDYNPNDWNAFPEITPPVDVVMQVEFRASSEGTKAYWDGTDWRRCRNKGFSWDPVIEKDIDRYRPWGD